MFSSISHRDGAIAQWRIYQSDKEEFLDWISSCRHEYVGKIERTFACGWRRCALEKSFFLNLKQKGWEDEKLDNLCSLVVVLNFHFNCKLWSCCGEACETTALQDKAEIQFFVSLTLWWQPFAERHCPGFRTCTSTLPRQTHFRHATSFGTGDGSEIANLRCVRWDVS